MDQSARSAVLVRVQGPDPKGTKRNDQSFSLFDAGITTLSASGTILPVGDRLVVVTSANVLRPFLTQKNKCEPRSSPTALALSLT
jgi:peroxisomal leader peptide-processing protease